MLRRFLIAKKNDWRRPTKADNEDRLISEPKRIQFSIATLLGAVTLTVIVLAGVYKWHHWILRDSQPYAGDLHSQWFIDSRQRMFDWSTPILATFILVASFSILYAIVDRSRSESVVGGLSFGFPLLLPLGPVAILALYIPLMTPLVGCWLIFRRRCFLGLFVIVFSVSWLCFCYRYIGAWFAVYGD